MIEPAFATTITLNNTNSGNVADAYVSNASKTTNYGTSTLIHVRQYTGTNQRYTWLMWNLSGIPDGATITNANMSLYVETGNAALSTVYHTAYNSTNNWTESNLTWDNQTVLGILQQNSTITTAVGRKYWNVTDAAISSYGQANKNMSITIKGSLNGASDWTLYDSKEYATTSNRPQLVITYTVASGTQYNLTGNESATFSFGATRQLIAARTGAAAITFAASSSVMNSSSSLLQYFFNSTNSTIAGTPVEHRLFWNDTSGLSGYIFSFKNSTSTDVILNQTSTNDSSVWHELSWDAQSFNYTNDFTLKNISLQLSSITGNPSCNITIRIRSDNSGLPGNILFNSQTNMSASSVVSGYNIFLFNNTLNASTTYWFSLENVTTGNLCNSTDNFLVYLKGGNPYANGMNAFSLNNGASWTSVATRDENFKLYGIISSEFVNDTWIAMSGVANWSNVTKVVNSIVGTNISWKVYANDSSNNWNASDVFSYLTTNAGNMYNLSGALTFSLSIADFKKLLASRSGTSSITFSDGTSRTSIFSRASSLSMTFAAATYKTVQKIYSLLSSLSLSFSESSIRSAVLKRTDSLSLTFSTASLRTAILKRLSTLTGTFSLASYVAKTVGNQVYQRFVSLTLTMTEAASRIGKFSKTDSLSLSISASSFRNSIMKRLTALTITLSTDANSILMTGLHTWNFVSSLTLNLLTDMKAFLRHYVWVEVGKNYDVCAILQQIGKSRAYLCVYDTGDFRILIRGL